MGYMKDIAPIMVNLLLTVHPKLRSASCKALAGLVKGIGVKNALGMSKWIGMQLRKASISDTKNIQFIYEEIDCSDKVPSEAWKEELEEIRAFCVHEDVVHRVSGITLLVDFHRFISCFKNHKE
jgi:hypothetical protein